jgi:hypothetical protein
MTSQRQELKKSAFGNEKKSVWKRKRGHACIFMRWGSSKQGFGIAERRLESQRSSKRRKLACLSFIFFSFFFSVCFCFPTLLVKNGGELGCLGIKSNQINSFDGGGLIGNRSFGL